MQSGFDLMDRAFESLGRAVLLLDKDFRVIEVGRSFEKFVCEGAGNLALKKPFQDIFFETTPRSPLDLEALIKEGKILEAKRSFLMCPLVGAVPVSLSAAEFCEGDCHKEIDEKPRYIVAIRPTKGMIPPECSVEIPEMVAVSPAMKAIVALTRDLAFAGSNILITGESGTGKEVLARTIHEQGRKKNPFVALNCAAFPGDLLENELFGHARGAYTGAHRTQPGKLELAGNGTLFLDEIGDMPLNLQVKLLRVLQERTFCRLGDPAERRLHARVISATNIDLERAVREGRFREDLFYRLNVVPLHIPPLRERSEDLEPLALHLLEKVGKRTGKAHILSQDALKRFAHYAWPGNVRELENALEYAVTFCKGQFIQVHHLPTTFLNLEKPSTRPYPASKRVFPRVMDVSSAFDMVPPKNYEIIEKEMILNQLENNQWNKLKTAKDLGMGRTTLYRKLAKYGLA